MRKCLERNKEIIIFYILIIIIASICTYRFNELNNDNTYESITISEQELAIVK